MDALAGLLADPEGYYRPEPEGSTTSFLGLKLALVADHPLWGHLLWNAARLMATDIVPRDGVAWAGLSVLELGAGAALPALVAARDSGAARIVATDYPDEPLLDNIRRNVAANDLDGRVTVEGFLWGAAGVPALLRDTNENRRFDRILMADLVFNHSQHEAMLDVLEHALDPVSGVAHITFSHHRPHKAELDMALFQGARERGFDVRHIESRRMSAMFKEDLGPEEVRATVHVYEVRHE